MFNVFVNDLLNFIGNSCEIYNYADDNSISYHHKDPNTVKDCLEQQSSIAVDWFNDNYMQANPGKFQAIVLCGRNQPQNITFHINGNDIQSVPEAKLLGVIFDENLSFIPHVTSMCKKASRQVNALSRISKHLSKESRMRILNAFIQANFDYCPTIYHLSGRMCAGKIEKLYERALRVAVNDYKSPYRNVLDECNMLMIYEQHEQQIMIQVYKVLHELAPPIPSTFYSIRDTPYNLRDSSKIILPKYHTVKYGYNSLKIQGAILWNSLPSYVKQAENLASFKHGVNSTFKVCHCGSCFKCMYRT